MSGPAPKIDPTVTQSPDAEVEAIQKVNSVLSGLDLQVVQRVLRWAADKFGVSLPVAGSRKLFKGEHGSPSGAEEDTETSTLTDFASLYDGANPRTDPEKALVAGYWLQRDSNSDWDSQSANKELKNLGHGVGNITDSLGALINRSPRLVMQTRKEGTSKQARKKYKLTVEGTRKVKQMLSDLSTEES